MEWVAVVPVALWVWATLVGVDLVSVPQSMIARPLVAAVVAGALLGDVLGAARVGLVLELYALDVVPVGAARYPDYGAASAGAVVVAAGQPWEGALGIAVAVGLLLAALGGWTMPVLRQMNSRAVARHREGLNAGDPRLVRRLQYEGLVRDAARSGFLAFVAIASGLFARSWVPLDPGLGRAMAVAVTGAGLATALGGAVRTAGRTARLKWLGAGLVAGGAIVVAW